MPETQGSNNLLDKSNYSNDTNLNQHNQQDLNQQTQIISSKNQGNTNPTNNAKGETPNENPQNSDECQNNTESKKLDNSTLDHGDNKQNDASGITQTEATYEKELDTQYPPSEQITDNETQEQNEWFMRDREDFFQKYPDVDAEGLFEDKSFINFADGKVGQVKMSEIYYNYLELCATIEKRTLEKAEKEFAKRVAKANSSPGSLTETSVQDGLYSLDELKRMSHQAIWENWDKVQKSLKSLKK